MTYLTARFLLFRSRTSEARRDPSSRDSGGALSDHPSGRHTMDHEVDGTTVVSGLSPVTGRLRGPGTSDPSYRGPSPPPPPDLTGPGDPAFQDQRITSWTPGPRNIPVGSLDGRKRFVSSFLPSFTSP